MSNLTEPGRILPDPSAGSVKLVPVSDDQPTVITHRAAAMTDSSDSAIRILHGRILPGDRLGHFDLVQYVGGGGMGRVFRAVDTRLARTVAIKILSAEQAADREVVLRFQNEAQSAARLDHENIARVHYVGEDRGLHYIVFEFIEGVNVRELVESKGPLPLAEAISYTLQVADALAHAASRNVVHRDIKPSNLLITPEGQAKLIDMGLARLREINAATADLTASGVTLGTFDYISPEQARDPRNADVRSDIYSLGCTFFFMLTGRPPFPGGTMLQKLLQHQADQPPDVRQFRPELHENVARMLRKMLAKDPAHRYHNPAELVNDLLMLAQAAGLRRAAPGSRTWVLPAGSPVPALYRHLPWLMSLAALIAIVVGLNFVWPRLPNPETVSAGSPVTEPDEGLAGLQAAPQVDTPPSGVAVATHNMPPIKATSPVVPPTVAKSVAPAAGGSDEAAVAPATGSTVAPSPEKPVAKPAGLLIVSPQAKGAGQFATLDAACRAASPGDAIELRYNGPREESPITLANPRLTILAGKGYDPVVVFRPTTIDPVKSPGCMMAVTAGRLSLVNVPLVLIVPRQVPADTWSLIEIRGSQSIRMEKCSLSIQNASDQLGAYHQEVAFFRVRSAPGADSGMGDEVAAPAEPASIDLTDCIARGEATFLRSEDMQPVHLAWENGVLATTERLLSSVGGPRLAPPGDIVRLDLRHLTATVRGGLCRIATNPMESHQLPTQIDCVDSILTTAPSEGRPSSMVPGTALIEQLGDEELDDLRNRITWNGDRNFYEGFDAFWSVHRLDPEIPSDAMTFDTWKAFWGPEHENLPKFGKVGWKKLAEPGRAVHGHVVADYALSDSADHPARGTASDGQDAGCIADRLPALPADSPATASPGERPTEKPVRPDTSTSYRWPIARPRSG